MRGGKRTERKILQDAGVILRLTSRKVFYRTADSDGYGHTWFETFRAFERRARPGHRHRHEACAVMQTDYHGHSVPVVVSQTGDEVREAQVFVVVLGASSYTSAMASFTQALPDWISAARARLLRRRAEYDRVRQSEGCRDQAAVV